MTERRSPKPLALRARLAEIESCWLELRCGQCGRIATPAIKLLIRKVGPGHQLGAVLPRLCCELCKVPPAEAWLNERHNRERNGGGEPGWLVQLIP